jgi:FkbM family methyltransferase
MGNYLKKLIWKISSLLPHFKGKEMVVGILSRPSSDSTLQIKRQGIIWSLNGCDLNEFSIAVRKNHSPSLSIAIEKILNDRNIRSMWDIGANIGAISLPLLYSHSKLNIAMFEPSPEVAGRLIANFANNPTINKNGKIFNIALSNADCLTQFYVSRELENSGLAGLGDSLNRYKFSVTLQSYKGDTLIDEGIIVPPELIKIDVEGFEFEVFSGLINTLKIYKPVIIFEHSLYRIAERKQDKRLVVDFLESLGYQIYRLDDTTLINPTDLESDADFIAKHST